MKITSRWKEYTKVNLKRIFGDRIDEESLDKYLDSKIQESNPGEMIIKLRNVYENSIFELSLDDILEKVEERGLIIGGNGSFALNQHEYMSPVSKELIRMKKLRGEYKSLMNKAIAEGDKENEIFYLNLQTHVKQSTNAYYGIQLQPGSFLYNPDTASFITIHAREMISEMMWTLERLLEGNPQFLSFDEFMNYLVYNLERPDIEEIDFLPSLDDLRNKLKEIMMMIPKYMEFFPKVSEYFEEFLSGLGQKEITKLYYVDNLNDFVFKNPRILNLIVDMMNIPIGYRVPGMIKIKDDWEESKKANATRFNEKLKLFTNLVLNYVSSPISNYRRIEKYLTRYRKAIVLSDTDSVMINLGNWTTKIGEITNIPTNPFVNEENSFKIVNIFSHLCTQSTFVACQNFCKMSNVLEEYRYLAEMKNEFLFERMISYASSKKAYAALKRLREGIPIDEIEWKGLKFVGSKLSPLVKEVTRSFIEDSILRKPIVDPSVILEEVRRIEAKLKKALMDGDMSLGNSVTFSGDSYKNIYTNAAGRSCLIWNLLYPDDPIKDGEYAYLFDTTLVLPEDVEKLKDTFPDIYSEIKEKIYNSKEHPQLAKYGIPYFAIPKESNLTDMPLWLKSVMDVDGMVYKHMQPISSLLPSLQGLNRSRISSTQYIHTNIVHL